MGLVLDIQLDEVQISVEEAVYRMVEYHDKKDDEGFKKAFKDYRKYSQRYIVGERMKKHNLDEWDWKWASETGNLCDYDWELFGDDIIKAGVDKEAFDKRWKREK